MLCLLETCCYEIPCCCTSLLSLRFIDSQSNILLGVHNIQASSLDQHCWQRLAAEGSLWELLLGTDITMLLDAAWQKNFDLSRLLPDAACLETAAECCMPYN